MQQFLTKWYGTWHGCSSFMRKTYVKISKRSDETALNAVDISKVYLKANNQRNDVIKNKHVKT